MTLFHLILSALIQGITEFLPISSSAHLILLPKLLALEDQGPLIDIMAHAGSLMAITLYFKKDVATLFKGLSDLITQKHTAHARLLLNILLASLPALFFGFFLHMSGLDILLRSSLIIATTTLVFGVLLWHADKSPKKIDTLDQIEIKTAFFIGLAQSLALIPGVSRSGITMTLGRYMTLSRKVSAHFSMLLALPLIGAFSLYAFSKLITEPGLNTGFTWQTGLIVAFLSFLSSYLVIILFMKTISKIGFGVFAFYRIVLGLFLFLFFYLNQFNFTHPM